MAKKPPTFEEALQQLEAITEQIEQGRIGLEESISRYEEGMKLVQYCRALLEKAEQKIEQLQLTRNGEPKVTEFESPPDNTPESTHNSRSSHIDT
jgi:exodeoxyribonuclease VII small subunit